MDSGPVIMFEGDDYIGRAVNVASRICDEAAPDQLLATRSVARDIPEWVALGHARALALKGFADAIEVVSIDVAAAPSGEAATDPVCGLTIPARFAIRPAGSAPSAARFCSLDCAEALASR